MEEVRPGDRWLRLHISQLLSWEASVGNFDSIVTTQRASVNGTKVGTRKSANLET
jgi:hypothetical protein